MLKEILSFTSPLLITGILHHFIVIQFNLFPFLAKPIDCGITLQKKRIFGNSKTFRGFIFFTLFTGFFLWLINHQLNMSLNLNSFLSGMLLGFGYSLGELPNSFLKRKFQISESTSTPKYILFIFSILDQTDSIIGALIFLHVIYSPSRQLIFILFTLGTFFHIIIDSALYKFGYKRYLSGNNKKLKN